MGDSSDVGGNFNNSDTIELTGKITVVVVLMIFLVIVFIFLLHVYARWFWYRRREQSDSAAPRRRLDFAQEYNSLAALRRGLDPLTLKTIPVVVFDAKDFKDGLECAVCLCEVSEGEKTRLLPKCNHGFHVECIDMWFQSHSTCPICRNLVANESTLESLPESEQSQDSNRNAEIHASEFPPNFPTNVLFWGNEVEVRTLGNHLEGQQQGVNSSQQPVSEASDSSPSSSRSASNGLDGELVIEVPQEVTENEEPVPKSPPQTRFRTLKRLLIRDTRVNPTIPREVDIEQGTRS